ncbi:MAG: ABC transporter ATP-binding protein [Candidatus Methanomethylicota archaeon]|uniref:ABC transporter ATP-binding protein n=1 Tax=Thermoproteota archaeon TaxID=2056631 RepID=A0A497ET61_9CREN|nr:MAG: ABC transporter ATP-binding protein [Candidatus Verstraetearchaeota archaeon]RLE52419.1 MAG: ABC transporter ATP-binding protein [Candidatus Verstraetearchaeota archaeon]
MDEVIKTIDLWKVYKLGKVEYAALRGVNLAVKRGEMIAVVGPSGSGKSTLLNLIGALDRPTKGQVFIDGVDISRLKSKELAELRNKKIGFVFQMFNLIPYMTALENVEVPMIASGIPPKERRERAMQLLEAVGLAARANNKPSELSGGEQQRVAIARALANSPSIVLADEPTGNLDSKSAWDVVNLLKKINEERNVTIVIVTHNLEITSVCNRVVYLRDGMIEREVVAG